MQRQHHLPTFTELPYFCLPESVGWYREFPAHVVTRDSEALDSFSIHLVTEGRGFVRVGDETYTLGAGDAFLYFPLMAQRYYSCTEEPWDVRWVHFYGGARLVDHMGEIGFRRTVLWTVPSWKELLPPFLRLLEEAEAHSFLRLSVLSSLTYAYIAEFISRAEPFRATRGGEAPDRIARLLPLIRSRSHEPFVLEAWAEQAGVSTHYFCKLFRKATQMTPMEFVTLCRIQKAKQLLLERSEWPVKRVAEAAGYDNASYFNKRFMEQEQVTPLEYRRIRLGHHR